MLNKIHKETMKMTIEANDRGAFTDNYTERDLFEKDMKDVIEFAREKMTEKEINWILDDCTFLANFKFF